MKILYAIQGTGNGHLSRARDVYPELCKHGEVDVLISGIQADVDVPFPVKYSLRGLSFIFGTRGGVSISATARSLRLPTLLRDIRCLPVRDYDLIVNDFEPVSAWAAKLRGLRCVSLSHQWAVLHASAPRATGKDWLGAAILRHYAPVSRGYGFHFHAFAENVFTPVIRREVRALTSTDEEHYTVYLPAYADSALVAAFSRFPDVHWQVFSKHNRESFVQGNVSVQPINNEAFLQSMASSAGVLCGAGFEGPAEALFLRKKLLAIPMQGQYEQQCNAAALAELGVPIIPHLDERQHDRILSWLESSTRVRVDYPDQTAAIIDRVVRENAPAVRRTREAGRA